MNLVVTAATKLQAVVCIKVLVLTVKTQRVASSSVATTGSAAKLVGTPFVLNWRPFPVSHQVKVSVALYQ